MAHRMVGAPLALPIAPVLGWAVHSVIALLLFFVLPFDSFAIAAVALATLLGSIFLSERASDLLLQQHAVPARSLGAGNGAAIPPWVYAVAALLALTSAAAILPKTSGLGVLLADQMFDHSKIAIIDDMDRLGLPPGNPFFAHDGGDGRLAYYYLYYFSAAQFAHVFHAGGWNADVALTFFSVFSSLCLMMALAVNISGRRMAALWVVAAATCSSWRSSLEWLFGRDAMEAWLPAPGGFGGWLFQSGWVPQHLLACSCVVVAVLLMCQLADRRSLLNVVALGLLAAAGFETSTWVGGVTFAVACLAVVPVIVWQSEPKERHHLFIVLAVSGILAVLAAWPFLMDQASAAARRQSHAPIALHEFAVLGPALDASAREVLDPPAFWLLLLPIELSAVYLGALAVVFKSLHLRHLAPVTRRRVLAFVALGAMALLVSWLLASTLADNNDLSWRAALLACSVMVVFAGIGLTVWSEKNAWLPLAIMLGAMALGLPETVRQIGANLVAHDEPEAERFAADPSLWDAVRRVTPEAERVANNPYAFRTTTPWPVNISWALMANRRSCYAGWELAQVYTSVPHAELYLVDVLFKRVFDGTGSAEDIKALATTYDCATTVVSRQDGAWTTDPFAHSRWYQMVDQRADAWRIYRRRTNPSPTPNPSATP